jgi:hypothetical protein
MSVLMEARAFNDSNFVRMHPKRCCQHLVKLLWFATQGDAISGPESRESSQQQEQQQRGY